MVDKTEIIYDLIFKTDASATDVASLNVQLKTANDLLARTQKSASGAANAVNKAGKAYGKAGQGIQNASFQVADFFTQIEGGVAINRAAAQQLPQLLAGFGAFGAAVGAAVSILPLLGSTLLGTSNGAAVAAKAMEDLAAAQELANSSAEELFEKYGNLGGAIQKVAQNLAKLNADIATQAIIDQAKAAEEATATNTFYVRFLDAMKQSWKELGEVASVTSDAISGALGLGPLYTQEENNLSSLRREYGLTAETVNAFGEEYLNIQRAFASGDFEKAAELVGTFQASIEGSSISIRNELSPVLKALLTQLQTVGQTAGIAADQVNRLAKVDYGAFNVGETVVNKVGGSDSEAAKQAAKDQKKALSEAAAEAKKAATEYQNWLLLIERGVTPLQQTQAQLDKASESFARFNDQMSPEQRANAELYLNTLRDKIAEITFKERWDEMEKKISDVKTPLMEFTASVNELGKTMSDTLASGVTDAFMAFVDGSASAEEAFKQFVVEALKQITSLIVKMTMLYAIQSALGLVPGGGIFSQLFGGVYAKGGAFAGGREVKAFANGGVVNGPTLFSMSNGQTGLMGEAGPEAIVPLTRRGGKLGVEASPVNVTVINNSTAQIRTSQSANGGLTIEVVQEAVATALARGGNSIDRAMQAGYGLRRAGR